MTVTTKVLWTHRRVALLSFLLGTTALTPAHAYEAFGTLETSDSAPGSVGSDTLIDETRQLNPDGALRIRNVAGSVNISTWNRNEVGITGTLGAGSEKLEISGDPSHLDVEVRLPRKVHNVADTDLQLHVPVGAHVSVETVSASVSAHDLAGPITVNTVSGDVGLRVASAEVAVQTVSGDLTLNAPAQSTHINTVSGDVKLNDLRDQLSVETVSGNVALDGGRFSELRLKSISGDMRVNATFAPQAKVNGETLSGNIVMAVPANLSGMAKIKTFSGETQCDGARSSIKPKNEYLFGTGTGVHVELSSFSGNIQVQKQ